MLWLKPCHADLAQIKLRAKVMCRQRGLNDRDLQLSMSLPPNQISVAALDASCSCFPHLLIFPQLPASHVRIQMPELLTLTLVAVRSGDLSDRTAVQRKKDSQGYGSQH